MSSGSPKRTRSERVAAVELPPGKWAAFVHNLQRGPVLLRLALCVLVALVLWAATLGWNPPLEYRLGEIPHRDVVARTTFTMVDEEATRQARADARRVAEAVYDQDSTLLVELKAQVLNELTQLAAVESYDKVDKSIWSLYQPEYAADTPRPTDEEEKQRFDEFKEALKAEGADQRIQKTLDEVFQPLITFGVLEKLLDEGQASAKSILLRRPNEKAQTDKNKFPTQVELNSVLVGNLTGVIQKKLEQGLASPVVAPRVFDRIRRSLPSTLTYNEEATAAVKDKAASEVDNVLMEIEKGAVLAPADEPIGEESMKKLRLGHDQRLKNRTLSEQTARSFAVLGLYVALYTLCGFYIYRHEPKILKEFPRLASVLVTVVVAVLAMKILFLYNWQAELIPLLMFGMTMAIAYSQSLALLLSTAVTLISVTALGTDLHEAIVLMASTAGAIIVLDSVRSRGKLLSVGMVAAAVAFFTNLGVGTLEGDNFFATLQVALRLAIWGVIAGALMTSILQLVERLYGVQTDLRLLELGDPAHPLLQELVRRAPGTYNHSINVASLAEAAAESIGARGLLVRVGAYFHDIGKMLKPGYFIENQSQGGNRHDALVPAMSTLVIIAHVKDGADLARQHKLPEPIIDFIQQHHGTTLVEYFYRQATDRKENDPDAAEVDESSFRYPGPKPQTKEAGVLMLSDAVESASRVLVEPTPARIESLVEDISHKRLLDGQFDECGLTLEEVRKVGDSLVKSLTAVYHGRVKYPDQETA